MNKKNSHTLSPLVLLSLLSFLSLLTPLPVQAQAYRLIPGDVLTFEGGAEDSNMPDVYVVDITNTPAAGSTIPFVVNRPKGAEANYPVSVDYRSNGSCWAISLNSDGSSASTEGTLTFAAGDMTKTLYLAYDNECGSSFTASNMSMFLFFIDGNRTQTEQSVVQFNWANPNAVTPGTVNDPPAYEAVPWAIGRIGDYILHTVFLYGDGGNDNVAVVNGNTQLTPSAYRLDHASLAVANDDWTAAQADGMSRLPVVKPREKAGTITNMLTFLYKLDEENVVSNYDGDYGAEPAALFGGELVIELAADSPNTETLNMDTSLITLEDSLLLPHFGSISLDKAEYNSGEAVTFSVPVLNWKLCTKILPSNWTDRIDLTLDNGATIVTSNKAFDSATGLLSWSFNAPALAVGGTDSIVYAELRVHTPDRLLYPYGAYDSIRVHPEAAPTVYTDSILVSGLPEQLKIFREKKNSYQLGYTVYPSNASFLGATWTTSDAAVAEVSPAGVLTTHRSGRFVLTLTGDEVAYREQNNEAPNNDILIRSFTVIVHDSLPKLSGAQVWGGMDGDVTVNFFYRLKEEWQVKPGEEAELTFTLADGTTRSLSVAASSDGTINCVLPFDNGFERRPSAKDSDGNWIPSCHVAVALPLESTLDGEEYTMTAETDVFIRHNLIQVKGTAAPDVRYTGAQVEATAEVLNLTSDNYTISYRIADFRHTVLESVTFTYTGTEQLPAWFAIDSTRSVYSYASLRLPFTPNAAGSYYAYIYAENSTGDKQSLSFNAANLYAVDPNDVTMRIRRNGTYYDLDGYPSGNSEAIDRLRSLIQNKANKTDRLLASEVVDSLNRMLSDAVIDFCVSTGIPPHWGPATATLSHQSDTLMSMDFYGGCEVRFPMDGKTYTVTWRWPKVDVTKTFSYTCYGIDDMLLYTFPIILQSGKQTGESLKLEWWNRNGAKDSLDITNAQLTTNYGPETFVLYLPDSIAQAQLTSSNPNRPARGMVSPPAGLFYNSYARTPQLGHLAHNKGWATYLSDSYRMILGAPWPNILIRLQDSIGNPITNATLRYVTLDPDKRPLDGRRDSVTTTNADGEYAVPSTAMHGPPVNGVATIDHSVLIEVDAPGYTPKLVWYDNQGQKSFAERILSATIGTVSANYMNDAWVSYVMNKDRQENIVLDRQPYYNATFITTNSYSLHGGANVIDLKKLSPADVVTYSERFAEAWYSEWSSIGVPLNVSLPFDGVAAEAANIRLSGKDVSKSPSPDSLIFYNRADYGFAHSYVDLFYQLKGFLPAEGQTVPALVSGQKALAQLPGLKNKDVSPATVKGMMEESLGKELTLPDINVGRDGASTAGDVLNDSRGVFDKFDIALPSAGLPFNFEVSRDGNSYSIRGVVAVNFVPGGQASDLAEMGNDFNQLYNDCMKAVSNSQSNKRDIPAFNSAFVGIRGYIESRAYYNPASGTFNVTIGGGGLSVEASANYVHKCSFGIGSFGVNLAGKLATTLAFQNVETLGENSGSMKMKMDIELTTEVLFKLDAWMEAGFDIYIAKAVVGVEGGLGAAYTNKMVIPVNSTTNVGAGHSFNLNGYMQAYAEARFLWWRYRNEWKIFDVDKTWYYPDNSWNPLHPDYRRPATRSSASLLSSAYQPADLRSLSLRSSTFNPVISNVGASASPRYLLGGNRIAYSNIYNPADNNDDHISLYDGSSSTSLDASATAPAFAFDAASTASKAVVVYEQMKQPVMESDLTDFAAEDAIKMMAPNVEVTGAVYNGATWTTAPLSDNTVANLNPRTAISADGSSAVALWSSGQIVIEDNGAQYVNGDLLFSRFDGSGWSTPIPVMGLDKNLILSDYSVALGNGGETLVLASRSAAEQAEIDELMFISVIPGTPDTVNIFSGGLRGTDAQITRVGDSFVASYVTATSGSRQDLYLATVDSLGRPAGKVGGFAGLANHTMYNVRVVADDDAQDLGGLAVLWNEARAVEVSGDSIAYQTGLYAAKLAKWDNSLYASYPVRLLTVPEGYRPAAYDAHLSGLNLKAAATLANETGGAGVMEGSVSFANSLACTGQDFDALNALPGDGIPVSLTLQNTGFEPVTSVTVTMGSSTKTTALDLLPGSSATVTGIYTVPDNFDGTIAYDISARFADPDMTLRSARLRASQPVTLSGSVNASTVDMYVEILSNTSGETHNNIVLKVGNHSGMPLANRGISTIYAGLYKDPQSREPYAGVSPTGIPATDLYEAGKGNMNRVVSFQLPAVTEGVVVWALVETKDNQGNVVTDTRTIDNFIPVQLYPEANAVASPAPAITTASLPNGQVGQPYSAQLAATGFSAITWGIASGPGLPGGLHLRDSTGIISGVPTTAGVFTFSVTATSDIAADTATLSIRIIQPDVEDADVEDVEDVEEPDEGEPTGIEDAEENLLAAQATDGGLLVSGLIPGEALSLYNLQGQLLFRQAQATTPQLLVPLAGKGAYIIAAGKRRLKAIY